MSDSDLFSLDEACQKFLGGLVKPSTLKSAFNKGELVLTKLGRKWVVSAENIRDWKSNCQIQRNPPASGFVPAQQGNPASTSFSGMGSNSAQAALKAKLNERMKNFRNSSPGSLAKSRLVHATRIM